MRKYSWVPVMMTGITFIIIGLQREERSMVLRKAIRICLECIGIG